MIQLSISTKRIDAYPAFISVGIVRNAAWGSPFGTTANSFSLYITNKTYQFSSMKKKNTLTFYIFHTKMHS